tara:strand:- start:331 stop:957 length:627 start_codon:yes stop_codon:yes gene_type:complete
MKKVFLYLFLFLVTNLSAQNFGIKAGSTFSISVADDNSLDNNNINWLNPGVYLGVFTNIDLSYSFSYQPEISFLQYGYNYSFEATERRGEYLENNVAIASNFEYFISDQLSLIFGPRFDYAIGGNTIHHMDEEQKVISVNNIIQSWSFKERVNYFLTIGICYKMNNLFIDLSYAHGRYHTQYASEIIPNHSDTKLRTQIIQTTIGFTF